MKKEIILFIKDELTFKNKFYILMDLLISNQSETLFESFILMGIFYTQIISSFFSEQIGIFDPKHSNSDKLLYYIEKIVRIKNFFKNSYYTFKILKYLLFIVFIFAIINFIILCKNITRTSFYSLNLRLINYAIKIFIYVGYNVIYDANFSVFCFGSDNLNPNFQSVDCSILKNIGHVIISILYIILSLFLYIFFSIYYNDTFYLSNSYYSKMSCNYDFFWAFNCLFISCLSMQVKYLTKEIFLLYNLIMSISSFIYYLNHYLYYDKNINIFTGIFHFLYVWTSIFCLIFGFIDLKEKGIIYIITSIIVCYFYSSIKNRIDYKIFLETPYYKIQNKFYVLFYLRNIIEKINNIEESYEDKSLLSAIIKIHMIECPNIGCLLKTNDEIYLPMSNKWSDKNKKKVEDEVFLKNFIVIIMNYFISTHDCSVDMYLNLSLYELRVIGNYCQAMYYYKKLSELKLTLKEKFSLIRLKIEISKGLTEKLKPSNEKCTELEYLNISQYFKYDSLSQSFIEEISNDVNLSLEFWNSFREPLKEQNKKLDFNKIFKLTDKIRITKIKIEEIWNKLVKIYDGVNDFFQIYIDYIEQINDDDLKRRDLEVYKRKNENIGEHLNIDFYSILFNKETGIIIVNGDKGSEGIIQLANNEMENIFKYKSGDLKGMNISYFMPKIFAKDHSKYMERYFKIGEKKFIDKSSFKSFGKDKNNYIIKLKIAAKIFPILNENVLFAALITKENIDDIILMDDKFIIQGMSSKLMHILNINNKYLFQENEIPFYVICKKFVNFFNIFLKGKQKKNNFADKKLLIEEIKDEEKNENKDEKDFIHDNIEINENVELEYEIKLPQFLIDYSEKTNKMESKYIVQLMSNDMEEEKIDKNNDDENESLLKSENSIKNQSNKKNELNKNNNITPTPTPNPTPDEETPNNNGSLISNSIISNEKKNINLTKYSQEEKTYNNRMKQYKTLFNEDKIDELEELIDNCNKNSSSIEYKFNFTFDKYKYGNKQISYIVRCVDTKNDIGRSDEESENEQDPKIIKYKKEKNESIKPLFELLDNERKEILKIPEEFLKLSLENKKFQKLLEICKNDIINMSKVFGHKNFQILENENSSQTSQTGYDNGLLKKNRIEEIRNNLMKDIKGFYIFKYLKIVFSLIIFISIIFLIIYIYLFYKLNLNLRNSFLINITLLETIFWTSEMINNFMSFKVLYEKNIIQNIEKFDFFDIFATSTNDNLNITNYFYYDILMNFTKQLYKKEYASLGKLEMEFPKYLNKEQLNKYFWNEINPTYMSDIYINYTNSQLKELFPMALSQFLSNIHSYIEDDTFNSISAFENFNTNKHKNNLLFEYMTSLIIENGYNNILPHLFEMFTIVPIILSKYNSCRKNPLLILISIYTTFMIILSILYIFLFISTNKSMSDGVKKMTKIRLEKIEEIIKKIRLFSINLKKYREKDLKYLDDNKNKSDLTNSDIYLNYNNEGNINEKEKNKKVQENYLVNNNGFNVEYKKYKPLNILNNLLYQPLVLYLIACFCLIPLYLNIFQLIQNTNSLLLVQNYIYGKLLETNAKLLIIKCFIIDCKNNTILDYSNLVNMDIIQNILKGINLLPAISNYYNEKFLLNACEAALDPENDSFLYNRCIGGMDKIITSANNTINLMRLIEKYVDYLNKEYEIKSSENDFNKILLLNSSYFRNAEYIYYIYIFHIEDIFKDLIISEFSKYLEKNKIKIYLLVIIIGIILIFFYGIYGAIIVNKLIEHLTISRCIMKIIPISIILNTPELETWIENKY